MITTRTYLMLLYNPDVFIDKPEMKDWTDSMFIDELKKEQAKDIVNTCLIPASVYKAAIEHYSFKSLHNKLRMEVECDQIDANVERFALRPMLTDPSDFDKEDRAPGSADCWAQKAIRNSTILFLGDSGSLIYNPNGKTKYTVDQFLNGSVDGKATAVRSRWSHLTGVSTCGADWKNWIQGLRAVLAGISKHAFETDPDNVERVPSWFHVFCFDNLNSLGADSVAGEDKRLTNNKPKDRTTYEGFLFLDNAWLQQDQ